MTNVHEGRLWLAGIAFVFFEIGVVVPAFSQPGFWQSLNGPEGGVVQCFAVDNNGHILAGTYFGGVYKTTNRGGSWVQVAQLNLDIRAFVVGPAGRIYLGAANSGVWKSTDGGTTWVRPANINMGGRTVTSLALNASGQLLACCASTSSQSVFWSPDSGENFFLVSSGVLSANSIVRQGTYFYVGGDRNGVLRSTDGGLAWTTINPSPAQFNGLSMTANANYVYVVGRRTAATVPDSSFIYRRSITLGIWELVRIEGGVILRTISSVGDTLLAAGDTTVLVSFNAGQSWIDRSPQTKSVGAPLGTFRLLTSYCDRDFQLGGSAGNSVAFSSNFGQTWAQSSQGLRNTHIVAATVLPNEKLLVSAQFDGLFLKDGANISRVGNGLPAGDVVTALASENITVLAGTANNGLYRSKDGGLNFSRTLYGMNASGIINISTKRSGNPRAVGKGEYVHTSTDGGIFWSSLRLPQNLTTNVTAIEEVSDNEYYVSTGPFGGIGNGDGVYRTTTGGSSWSQSGLQFVGVVSFDRTLSNKFLASSSVDVVYERDNAGSWTSTPLFTAGIKVRQIGFYEYTNQPLRELAGTSDGLYERRAFTSDPWMKRQLGGEFEVSWIGSRTTGTLTSGGPASFAGQVIVGTYGGGVYQSTAPITSVGESTIKPTRFALEQNYPNPFNPTTTLRYWLPVQSRITLKLYNILGQEVKTLVNDIQEAGYRTAVWNSTNNSGNNVATGVYFYRIEATSVSDKGKSFTEVKKMLLLK
jgi:photosystem II stability/assembly factor-like uncharacterized protein